MKFDEKNVKTLQAPAGKADCVVWDEGMDRFGLRFRNGKPVAYVIMYSLEGRERKMTIGKFKIGLKAAHDAARKAFGTHANKEDPASLRAKKSKGAGVRFGDKIEVMLDELRGEKRADSYIDEIKRTLNVRAAALHTHSIKDVDRGSVADVLAKIQKLYGPVARDRARSHLSGYFNWLIEEGFAEVNPVSGTEKSKAPPKPKSAARKKVYSEEEMAAFWLACIEGDDYSDIIIILMLTGARRNEIGRLHRDEVNLKERLIVLPEGYDAKRTKNREEHIIHMTPEVYKIIERRMRERNGDFLFGRYDGTTEGFSGWSKGKAEFTKRCGIRRKWHHHWFRDTMTTWFGEKLRLPPHIGDANLNHISSVESGKQGVAGVYNHAGYIDERVEALNSYERLIKAIVKEHGKLAA